MKPDIISYQVKLECYGYKCFEEPDPIRQNSLELEQKVMHS